MNPDEEARQLFIAGLAVEKLEVWKVRCRIVALLNKGPMLKQRTQLVLAEQALLEAEWALHEAETGTRYPADTRSPTMEV